MPSTRTNGGRASSKDAKRSQGRAMSKTRRFNGMEQTSKSWDGVRKDQDLWQEGADCLVHFYAQGSSKRGPSLKVPFAAVRQSESTYLLDQCLKPPKEQSFPATSQTSDSGYDSSETSSVEPQAYQLYVPAPAELSREQAYAYHVTTRNYFAFLTEQPLVGDMLGIALADLWERASQWQERGDTQAKLLNFLRRQGYLQLAENPHHATAALNLADRARLGDLWIDAFTHCVGMYDRLETNGEFGGLTNMTKALITRASLEMDLHISRVVRAVGGFLEEDYGAERLGLAKSARDHLDHFRSFLHAYYVDKLGYFPPNDRGAFDKALWIGMYHDFQSLYEFLVDAGSDGDMANTRSTLDGGVCVLQNVQAFDQRNGYTPLPHPLPLLPQTTSGARSTETQKTLRSFRLGRLDSTSEPRLPPRMALATATNSENEVAKARPIVQEYQRFERQKLEEKITIAEARKVRWLLIYGVLQMLISITKAPQGFEGADQTSYPLCVLTDGCPPWVDASEPKAAVAELSGDTVPKTSPASDESSTISIRPDCDAENAQDYFSLSRHDSSNTEDMTPAPLRITVPLSRTASIRTSVGALQRSVVGSISRHNSWRRSSQSMTPRPPGHREILVEGYGNGTEGEQVARSEALENLEGIQRQESSRSTFHGFDFGLGLNNVDEEPTLEAHQLDDAFGLNTPEGDGEPSLDDHQLDGAPTPRFSWMPNGEANFTSSPTEEDSPMSAVSGYTASTSTRSSYNERCSTPATDRSSFSGSVASTAKTSLDLDKGYSAFPSYEPTSKRASYAQRHLNFGTTPSCTSLKSLNAGTYQPSGIPKPTLTPAISKFASKGSRDGSTDSSRSATSSHYPTESKQADEIEEEELRGRRRLRAFDGFSFDY